MLASRADSLLPGSIEVFEQPDKPTTCGSHGPRSLSSCSNKRVVSSGDSRVFAHCIVDISKGLDCVPQTTEVLTYLVEALSPFSRQFCLRGLQLLDCLVVTFALFVEVRASQHREQVVRPRERQDVHHGATNEHFYARHYFKISDGMSPCLISMSLVAMARATSTTTMPTSRGVKSNFGRLPQIAILSSWAYPAAMPQTTVV